MNFFYIVVIVVIVDQNLSSVDFQMVYGFPRSNLLVDAFKFFNTVKRPAPLFVFILWKLNGKCWLGTIRLYRLYQRQYQIRHVARVTTQFELFNNKYVFVCSILYFAWTLLFCYNIKWQLCCLLWQKCWQLKRYQRHLTMLKGICSNDTNCWER